MEHIRSVLLQYLPGQKVDIVLKYWNEDDEKTHIYDLVYRLHESDKSARNDICAHWIRERYNDTSIWATETFTEFKNREDEWNEHIENPYDVVEGVVQCRRCKSLKTFTYQRQTRSCDEAITLFAQCVACGKSWKE